MTETIAAGPAQEEVPEEQAAAVADLRRTGIHPDFWYPVAVSASVRKKKTYPALFAGERIALYRGESGTVYALEDRCAHRQVPLSMGVVEGDVLRCCYHAWAYRGNGRISQIPYLPKGVTRPPRGVRAYPVREAYGLVFVFPGDPEKAATAAFPELPEFDSARHKTMTFSRTVQCHYSFMHENLLDMNHQFLHRGILGKIQPKLLGYDSGPAVGGGPVPVHPRRREEEPRRQPARRRGHRRQQVARRHHHQDRVPVPDPPAGPGERRASGVLPLGGLRARGCRAAHQPRVRPAHDREAADPGALHLAWPFIRRFTERVFAEDRMAVEAEQRAWDEQGEDWNREVFPLILDVRDVLRSNGVPIRSGSALCGAASLCGAAAGGCRLR